MRFLASEFESLLSWTVLQGSSHLQYAILNYTRTSKVESDIFCTAFFRFCSLEEGTKRVLRYLIDRFVQTALNRVEKRFFTFATLKTVNRVKRQAGMQLARLDFLSSPERTDVIFRK